MTVLDIPCGKGAFTERLLRRDIDVVSSDIVDELKTSTQNANYVPADMDKRLPFTDSHFSGIICIDGIEHIERQFDFVRECNRILKSSGRIILSAPNISAARSRWRYFLTGHHNKCKSPLNEEHVTPLHHKNMISFPELRYLLHTHGFEIESITTNRIKLISYTYILFMPFFYLTTRRVYSREESDPVQQNNNRQIIKAMFSKPVFFGETLIVSASKKRDLTMQSDP
ncbi:MAG: class I SAM-dependent methyltransferase [Candidatus Latescibacteria bacterium]|nr:class I SAM-dependent methyltransferase [Candidatus Latescibacterota bacterium]